MEIALRMALTALVIGTSAAVIGAGRVTLPLVAATTLCWGFVPFLQLLTGLVLVLGRGVDCRRALARYFATDRYWSTWTLALAAVLLLAPSPRRIVLYLLTTGIVPLVLTARALVALRRDMFGDSRAGARRIVAVHQAITMLLILGYVVWAGAMWARIVVVAGA